MTVASIDRESQSLDLREIWITQQTIEVNAKRMSGQLCVKSSTQTPKSVDMVLLNVELLRKLSIDGFDDLSDGIMNP